MGKVNLKQFLTVVCLLTMGSWLQAQIIHTAADQTINLTAGQVTTYVDEGDVAGNYFSGTHSATTICAVAGEVVTVTFNSFAMESGGAADAYDGMQIFDGSSTAATLIPGPDGIDGFGGSGCVFTQAYGPTSPGTVTSTAQCLTFDFCSDGSVTRAGWEADVSAAVAAATACEPPINGTQSNILGASVDLAFESVNTPVDDHCWNIYVGNEGFDCDENEEFIKATICNITGVITSDNPLVTVNSIDNATGEVSVHVTGLAPGTTYEWAVFETCDGMPLANPFDCSDALFGPFTTFDIAFTVDAENIESPSCPQASVGDPALRNNGSFDIVIGDSPSCAGTYDITVTPVANSAPDGTDPAAVTPATYVGVAPGTYSFTDVEAGSYDVVVTETSACNPSNDPETITVVVPDGVDMVEPTAFVFDVLGNAIADNDGATALDANADLGTHNLPEGACNYQEIFLMRGIDGCDGPMTDVTAVTATAVTVPGSIDPGTQVDIIANGFGAYAINIDWSVGTSTVTVVMVDVAGNRAVITLTRTVIDNVDATIVAAPINALIPVCADSRTINYGFTIVDGCDNEIALGAVPVTTNGFTGDFAEGNWAVTEDPVDESTVTFTATSLELSTHGSATDASASINMPGDGMLSFDWDFSGVDVGWDYFVIDVAGNLVANTDLAEGGNVNMAVNAGDQLIFKVDDDGVTPNFPNGALASVATITNFSFTQLFPQPVEVSTTFGTIEPGFYSDGNGYFEYQVTFDGPGTGLFNIDYTDDFGNVFHADVLIDVQNAAEDMPAIILAADDNVTIPHCEDNVQFCYSFQITDDCDPIDVTAVTFDDGGSGLSLTFIDDISQPKVAFFEACGTVDPGTYVFNIGYDGQSVLPLVNINQEANQPASIILPGNLSWTIPSCDTDLFTTMAVQICDDCDPVQTSEVVTTGFTGAFAEANWTIATDAGTGTAAVNFIGTTDMVLSTFDAGDFDGGDLQLDGINAAASIAIPSNGTVAFDYDFNGVDAGWDWFVITVDGAVRASDEFAASGSFSENFVGGEILLIGIDDDGAAPIGTNDPSQLTINNFSFAVPPAGFSVTLGGVALTPWYTNAQGNCTYVEYPVTLTAANNLDLLEVSYTDADGATTNADAAITVADHPDTWAPIIIYPSQDIVIDLDPCGPAEASVLFEVTITDNCSTFGNGLTGTVTALTSNGLVAHPSAGGLRVEGFFPVGDHVVTATGTDAAGNTRTEDFHIIVTQDAAVPANLVCSADFNLTLNDGCQGELIPSIVLNGEFGCLTEADFNITVVDGDTSNGAIVDGCGDFPYVVELATEPATNGFVGAFAPANWLTTDDPADNSSVTFTPTSMTLSTLATGPFDGQDLDINGLDAIAAIAMPSEGTLSFDYDYNGYDAGWDWFVIGIDGSIVAASNFAESGTISQDVSAGMVFLVAIDDDGLAPVGPDLPSVVVIDNFVFQPAANPAAGDFTTCWGNLTAEDKTPPTVDCPDDTDSATFDESIQELSGSLTDSDPTLVLNNYSCFQERYSLTGEANHYDLFTFTVSQNDIYTFYGIFELPQFDFTGYLFAGTFNEDSPCSNILAGSNNGTDGFVLNNFGPGVAYFAPNMRVSLPLVAGQTYTLMTSATGLFGTSLTGDYLWEIVSDGNGRINGLSSTTRSVSRELVCDDFDQIHIEGSQTYATDADGNTLGGTMSSSLRNILDATGRPVVGDNCGNVLVTVWDDVQVNGDCGTTVITRHFRVEDKYESACTGVPMTDECVQIITIRKGTMDEVVFPPLTSVIECDETIPYDANGHPAPSLTGYPFIQTAFGIHDLAEVYCNLSATYHDEAIIEVCAGTTKFYREWLVTDWCEPGQTIEYLQLIKVGDFTAPELTCNEVDNDWDGIPDTRRYSVGPYECTASFAVPMPEVSDNCSDGFEVLTEIISTVQEPIWDQWNINIIGYRDLDVVTAVIGPNDNRFISGVEKGCHWFQYTVTDACGNTSTLRCPFIVEDQVAPTASCDDQLNVSIGGGGGSRIYAYDVDEGSNDNCSDVRIEVRRSYANGTYSPWGDYVDFDCDDVHNFVTIELRVWDDRNMDGIIGNTTTVTYCDGTSELVTDNSNKCWMEIQVEDKIAPYCQAPHNQSLHCDDDAALHLVQNLDNVDWLNEHFGEAIGTDNCTATAEQTGVINGLNDCGWGTITRRFRAIDGWGLTSTNTCRQVISIYEVHDYEIKFPKDASANCGTPNPDTIETFANGCDLFAINVFDTRYEASGDECYKILRRYRVINWCEYDGEALPIVIGRDEDCDNNPGDEDVYVIVRTTWNGNDPIVTTYLDRDQDETNTNPLRRTNRCTGGPTLPGGHWATSDYNTELTSVGHWEYTQLIKVYDNQAPVVTADPDAAWDFCSYDNVDCTGDVSIDFSVEEECTPNDVTVEGYIDLFNDGVLDGNATVTGSYPNYTISGTYPLGEHRFGVRVDDGCGNEAWLDMVFTVVDCKAPSPICISGLAVELMPVVTGGGMMAVWATDYIASDIQDCSGIKGYSIHKGVEVVNGTDVPSYPHPSITLTCEDEATTIVRIYAWDNANNPYAVQPDGSVGGPNYDYCESFVIVQDWNEACPTVGSRVAGAIMTEDSESLEGAEVALTGSVTMDAVTPADGTYSFENIANGSDVTVTPQLDVNPLNGVSTFDLVLISKHILGIQLLDSPYKMIAADVNNSSSISTMDIIQLRKLILCIYTEFPSNTSWRFVDEAYTFPGGNPFTATFPEVVSINNIAQNEIADFVAVKVGDVNGSAAANLASVEERTLNGVFAFNVAEQAVVAGTQVTVDFTAADIAKVSGYQATLTFDQSVLSLNDIVYNVATEENFGTVFVNEGVITTSWNGEANNNDVLFSLVFDVKANANLSNLLGVSSRYTKAEAYVDGNVTDVAINFTNGTVEVAGFEVYQNTPNPFKGETVIGYNLPADAQVTLTVQDVTGKTLKVISNDGVKGYNTVTLSSKDLATSGVLYYTVSTDEFTATKKMVVVK